MQADERQRIVAALAASHGRRVRRFLARHLRNSADVADLAQEVFLRFLRVDRQDKIRNPQAYLLTIAGHVLHQHMLNAKVQPEPVDITEALDEAELIDESDLAAQIHLERRLEALERALARLSVKTRLEVLHGPQGVLFGGSTMGGAIRYISARPNLSQLVTRTAAGVTTTRQGDLSYTAEGVINIPIISNVLAVRAGAYYLREGGYVDNVANGEIENTSVSSTPYPVYTPTRLPSLSTVDREDNNFADVYVGRLSVLWQPDPSWSIRPAVVYQNTEQNSLSTVFTNQGELSRSWRFPELKLESRDVISSLDINKKLGKVDLTSVTAYTDREAIRDIDFTYFLTYPTDAFGRVIPHTTRTFSQEFRAASADDSGFPLRWVVGAFYNNQKIDRRTEVYILRAPWS